MSDDADEHYDSGLDEWRKLPVFEQGVVILHLVEHIIESIKLDDVSKSSLYKEALHERHTLQMMENALLIPSTIATAHCADIYDLKMENATIVRKAAREILTHTRGLNTSGYKSTEYLNLLNEAIEEFRPLFAKWVQTFNPNEYVIDRWGLFNPPGISFDDSESEIAFNAAAFLRELEDDWDENSDDEEFS